ncbi:MAG: hypothetical protein DRO93_12125 [Candidatus Thorarchaeota archaeon]|nr:MAG: hypothetical protein DRO93_12125 [Candidatus Thorarchaeota archaeon]
MKTQLEFYMEEIKNRVERMYELAIHAFMQSIEAFKELDTDMAHDVQVTSEEIEDLAIKVEDNVFETIVRRQPVASDLRALATYNFVSHHIYRIGRYAYKVAHIVNLSVRDKLKHYKELESIPYMANLAKQTLDIAMKALLEKDLSEIDRLEELEAASDKETVAMFEEIVDYLKRMSGITTMSLYYIIVGRYCERAADHAFSIAERAVYMVTGKRKKLGIAYKGQADAGPH